MANGAVNLGPGGPSLSDPPRLPSMLHCRDVPGLTPEKLVRAPELDLRRPNVIVKELRSSWCRRLVSEKGRSLGCSTGWLFSLFPFGLQVNCLAGCGAGLARPTAAVLLAAELLVESVWTVPSEDPDLRRARRNLFNIDIDSAMPKTRCSDLDRRGRLYQEM
jgi:hypothetical protein